MSLFLETKKHLNKPTQRFECELVKRGDEWVLIRYVSKQDWHLQDTPLPVGTTTWAYYETGAPCVVWRMFDPKGLLLGHLLHICTDIVIVDRGVTYQDLLLDIWVNSVGKITLLDEDDLSDCVDSGAVSPARAQEIVSIAHATMADLDVWIQRLDELICSS